MKFFNPPGDATSELSNITVVFKLYDCFPPYFEPVPASPGQVSQVFPMEKERHVGEYCIFISSARLFQDE
jgi:hypothetical protein